MDLDTSGGKECITSGRNCVKVNVANSVAKPKEKEMKSSHKEGRKKVSVSDPNNGDSKQSRRTDRYDSSESSDSGIVTLSTSDSCSRSDITDPCSPYSPPGSEGEDFYDGHQDIDVKSKPPDIHCSSCNANRAQGEWQQSGYHSSRGSPSSGRSSSPSDLGHKPSRDRHVQGKITEYFKVLTSADKTSGKNGIIDLKRTQDGACCCSETKCSARKRRGSGRRTYDDANGGTVLRFPYYPRDEHSKKRPPDVCRWMGCDSELEGGSMLEHIQSTHVDSQLSQDSFMCRWQGCKVYEKTSCSLAWLKRHVLQHGGNKPFKCIVESCGQRFTTQLLLERHVNHHFNQTAGNAASNSSNGGSVGAKRSIDSTPTKLLKRNGRKLRYRKRPAQAHVLDYWDAGVMEGLTHRLYKAASCSMDLSSTSHVSLTSQVMARRVEESGKTKYLVHWTPEDVLPDEWLSEDELGNSKSVPISQLPPHMLEEIMGKPPKRLRKSRRK